MKEKVKFLGIVGGVALLLFQNGMAQSRDYQRSSIELIEEAQEGYQTEGVRVAEAERLNLETALLYKLYAIYEPERLPKKFQSDAIIKCGTPVLIEIAANWDKISPKTKEKMKPYLESKLSGVNEEESLDEKEIMPLMNEEREVAFKGTDTTPPKIRITQPKDGSVFKKPEQEIKGVITDNVEVASATLAIINNRPPITLSLQGPKREKSFNQRITLDEGINTLKIEAKDKAGNTGMKAIMVVYGVHTTQQKNSSDRKRK